MIIIYITEADVAAYHAQGWHCWRLTAHHGARRGGKTFIAVLHGG